MISIILYKLFKMKKYNSFIYRFDKNGRLLIATSPISCYLGLCSPSGMMLYHDEIKIKEGLNAN